MFRQDVRGREDDVRGLEGMRTSKDEWRTGRVDKIECPREYEKLKEVLLIIGGLIDLIEWVTTLLLQGVDSQTPRQ